MKKNSSLAELTLEELQTRKSNLKGAVIGLSIVMLAALITLIYLVLKNKNYALLGVAFGCSFTLLPSIIVLNQINSEIKSRNL